MTNEQNIETNQNLDQNVNGAQQQPIAQPVQSGVKNVLKIGETINFKAGWKPSMNQIFTGYSIQRFSKEEIIVEWKMKNGLIVKNDTTTVQTIYFPTTVSMVTIRKYVFIKGYKIDVKYLSDTSMSNVAQGAGQTLNTFNPQTAARKTGALFFKDEAEARNCYDIFNQIINEIRTSK